jgi:hypothetical protein
MYIYMVIYVSTYIIKRERRGSKIVLMSPSKGAMGSGREKENVRE